MKKMYRVWLEFSFAGAEPAEIEVASDSTGDTLETELHDAIMGEASIEWGYEEID